MALIEINYEEAERCYFQDGHLDMLEPDGEVL
jgi:hypothetical protein